MPNEKERRGLLFVYARCFGAVRKERERDVRTGAERERERVRVCLTKNVRRNKNDTCARLYSKEERKKMSRISMMMSVILRARDETEREVSQGERGMPHLCIVRAFF